MCFSSPCSNQLNSSLWSDSVHVPAITAIHIQTVSKQSAYQLCHISSMAVLLNGIISRNKNCVFFRGLNFSNELVLLKNVQTVALAITLVLTRNKTTHEINYKGKSARRNAWKGDIQLPHMSNRLFLLLGFSIMNKPSSSSRFPCPVQAGESLQ